MAGQPWLSDCYDYATRVDCSSSGAFSTPRIRGQRERERTRAAAKAGTKQLQGLADGLSGAGASCSWE
jgi:hypothetical protein